MNPEDVPNIDEPIIWKEFESKEGKKYRVGYPETDQPVEEKTEKNLKNSEFNVEVHWTVGKDRWIPTSNDVIKKTGITRYKLYQQTPNHAYKYILWFTNTETYDYYFIDEEGDFYRVNTFLNRDHYVEYNSNKPTIVLVKGH